MIKLANCKGRLVIGLGGRTKGIHRGLQNYGQKKKVQYACGVFHDTPRCLSFRISFTRLVVQLVTSYVSVIYNKSGSHHRTLHSRFIPIISPDTAENRVHPMCRKASCARVGVLVDQTGDQRYNPQLPPPRAVAISPLGGVQPT